MDINNHGEAAAKIEMGSDTIFSMSKPSQLHHSYVYGGDSSRIIFTSAYSISLQCQFDLASMPFDTQVCHMDTVLQDNSYMYVDLVPSLLKYEGSLNLLEFNVVEFAISTGILPDQNATRIHFVLKRRLQSVILTTFLPTLIVTIIVFTTMYMDGTNFNTAVMVNLTAMLVFTSM